MQGSKNKTQHETANDIILYSTESNEENITCTCIRLHPQE